MYSTTEGTARYAARYPQYRQAGFYRTIFNLQVSSLGIGTYLGDATDAADAGYVEALVLAGESGINFFDAAINYRGQRSERCLGEALKHLQRDEVVVCTKAGFLTKGAVPGSLQPDDVVGGMHSMSPKFLSDQIDRSLANMGIDTVDVFYLHNPETQLGARTREEFETRIHQAFASMEQLVERHKIRWYGAATWEGFRKPGALDLRRLVEIAVQEGGPERHFRFIQLPVNLGMTEAFTNPPENVLDTADALGVAVVASGTLMQGRVLSHLPDRLPELLPGLATGAQRAIQFTRSTPGIDVALAGMGRPEHVRENLGIAAVPPASREQYLRMFP